MRLTLDSWLLFKQARRRELQSLSDSRVIQMMPWYICLSLCKRVQCRIILFSVILLIDILCRFLNLIFSWTFLTIFEVSVVRNWFHFSKFPLLFCISQTFIVLLIALTTLLNLSPDYLAKLLDVMSYIVELMLDISIVALTLAAQGTLDFESKSYKMLDGIFMVILVNVGEIVAKLG